MSFPGIIEHESKTIQDALVYDGSWLLLADNVEVDYIDGAAWIDTTIDAEVAQAMRRATDEKPRGFYLIIPTEDGHRCYTLRKWEVKRDDGCAICHCKHVGFHAMFGVFYARAVA